MDDDEYLANGYPIGSGVVEGACRHLVDNFRLRLTMLVSMLALETRISVFQPPVSIPASTTPNQLHKYYMDGIDGYALANCWL